MGGAERRVLRGEGLWRGGDGRQVGKDVQLVRGKRDGRQGEELVRVEKSRALARGGVAH